MPPKRKIERDAFARFFEQPSRETLRELLKDHLGEQTNCDFKRAWPEHSSTAKQILGMANCGGGCIVVGVEEKADNTFEPSGLTTLADKADIWRGVHGFLPSELHGQSEVQDYAYDASEYPKLIGKKFQVVLITADPVHLPYVCMRDGLSTRRSAIYMRRQGLTEEASHDELQSLINARLATGYASEPEPTLRNNLEQLRLLQQELANWKSQSPGQQVALKIACRDCEHPEAFLTRMINLAMKKVQDHLAAGRR